MNVEVVLLRALAGELSLKLGTVLPGRVLDRGSLMLAGMRVNATLPENLVPGTPLSLRVREASSERLLLQVVDRPEPGTPAAAASLPPSAMTAAVTLPGGANARLLVDPDGGGEEGPARGARRRHSVTLRYESPRLGRVDLALTLDTAAVAAVAHAPAGDVADRLRAGAGDLRESLSQALGMPASVAIVAHGETLDVRA
jgi:hypothetical protein